MRDAKIVTLNKNKGDKGDCSNYRGISLLSITGKAFARIILKRLQRLANRVTEVLARANLANCISMQQKTKMAPTREAHGRQ